MFATLISQPEGPEIRPRSWLTSSGVVSHRGGPKTRFLVRFSSRESLSPQFPSAWPEGVRDHRCSTALLGSGPFHVALSPWGGNRPRTRKHLLFRRLLPTGPEIRSLRHRPEGQFSFEPHSIACRRRSVLPSLAAPSCRCRPSGEAGTSVPITIGTCIVNPSRAKRKMRPQACG